MRVSGKTAIKSFIHAILINFLAVRLLLVERFDRSRFISFREYDNKRCSRSATFSVGGFEAE